MENVEIMKQEVHQKTWFNRFKTKLAVTGASVTALAVSGTSHAFLAAADVTAATTGAGGEAVLKQAGIWVLSIVIGIAVVVKIISMVKK